MRRSVLESSERMYGGSPSGRRRLYRWRASDFEGGAELLGGRGKEARLLSYLSASFKAARRQTRELRIDRNRRLAVLTALSLLLYWVTYRVFL